MAKEPKAKATPKKKPAKSAEPVKAYPSLRAMTPVKGK